MQFNDLFNPPCVQNFGDGFPISSDALRKFFMRASDFNGFRGEETLPLLSRLWCTRQLQKQCGNARRDAFQGVVGKSLFGFNEAPAPKSGGPDVMFHTNFPQPGLYRAWGQFMYRGQIITSSFVVNVAAGAPATTSGAGAVDESKPHTH